jgi:hypothetical protein
MELTVFSLVMTAVRIPHDAYSPAEELYLVENKPRILKTRLPAQWFIIDGRETEPYIVHMLADAQLRNKRAKYTAIYDNLPRKFRNVQQIFEYLEFYNKVRYRLGLDESSFKVVNIPVTTEFELPTEHVPFIVIAVEEGINRVTVWRIKTYDYPEFSKEMKELDLKYGLDWPYASWDPAPWQFSKEMKDYTEAARRIRVKYHRAETSPQILTFYWGQPIKKLIPKGTSEWVDTSRLETLDGRDDVFEGRLYEALTSGPRDIFNRLETRHNEPPMFFIRVLEIHRTSEFPTQVHEYGKPFVFDPGFGHGHWSEPQNLIIPAPSGPVIRPPSPPVFNQPTPPSSSSSPSSEESEEKIHELSELEETVASEEEEEIIEPKKEPESTPKKKQKKTPKVVEPNVSLKIFIEKAGPDVRIGDLDRVRDALSNSFVSQATFDFLDQPTYSGGMTQLVSDQGFNIPLDSKKINGGDRGNWRAAHVNRFFIFVKKKKDATLNNKTANEKTVADASQQEVFYTKKNAQDRSFPFLYIGSDEFEKQVENEDGLLTISMEGSLYRYVENAIDAWKDAKRRYPQANLISGRFLIGAPKGNATPQIKTLSLYDSEDHDFWYEVQLSTGQLVILTMTVITKKPCIRCKGSFFDSQNSHGACHWHPVHPEFYHRIREKNLFTLREFLKDTKIQKEIGIDTPWPATMKFSEIWKKCHKSKILMRIKEKCDYLEAKYGVPDNEELPDSRAHARYMQLANGRQGFPTGSLFNSSIESLENTSFMQGSRMISDNAEIREAARVLRYILTDRSIEKCILSLDFDPRDIVTAPREFSRVSPHWHHGQIRFTEIEQNNFKQVTRPRMVWACCGQAREIGGSYGKQNPFRSSPDELGAQEAGPDVPGCYTGVHSMHQRNPDLHIQDELSGVIFQGTDYLKFPKTSAQLTEEIKQAYIQSPKSRLAERLLIEFNGWHGGIPIPSGLAIKNDRAEKLYRQMFLDRNIRKEHIETFFARNRAESAVNHGWMISRIEQLQYNRGRGKYAFPIPLDLTLLDSLRLKLTKAFEEYKKNPSTIPRSPVDPPEDKCTVAPIPSIPSQVTREQVRLTYTDWEYDLTRLEAREKLVKKWLKSVETFITSTKGKTVLSSANIVEIRSLLAAVKKDIAAKKADLAKRAAQIPDILDDILKAVIAQNNLRQFEEPDSILFQNYLFDNLDVYAKFQATSSFMITGSTEILDVTNAAAERISKRLDDFGITEAKDGLDPNYPLRAVSTRPTVPKPDTNKPKKKKDKEPPVVEPPPQDNPPSASTKTSKQLTAEIALVEDEINQLDRKMDLLRTRQEQHEPDSIEWNELNLTLRDTHVVWEKKVNQWKALVAERRARRNPPPVIKPPPVITPPPVFEISASVKRLFAPEYEEDLKAFAWRESVILFYQSIPKATLDLLMKGPRVVFFGTLKSVGELLTFQPTQLQSLKVRWEDKYSEVTKAVTREEKSNRFHSQELLDTHIRSRIQSDDKRLPPFNHLPEFVKLVEKWHDWLMSPQTIPVKLLWSNEHYFKGASDNVTQVVEQLRKQRPQLYVEKWASNHAEKGMNFAGTMRQVIDAATLNEMKQWKVVIILHFPERSRTSDRVFAELKKEFPDTRFVLVLPEGNAIVPSEMALLLRDLDNAVAKKRLAPKIDPPPPDYQLKELKSEARFDESWLGQQFHSPHTLEPVPIEASPRLAPLHIQTSSAKVNLSALAEIAWIESLTAK